MRNDLKIGDRFKKSGNDDTFEVSSLVFTGVPFEGDENYVDCFNVKTKYKDYWSFDTPGAWVYLGNFSKPDKFNELYNKLNNE
jgi:hypothetical protein